MVSIDEITQVLFLNTLGLSILTETIRMASYWTQTNNCYKSGHCSSTNRREARSCFAFIQGTGLDLFLKEYQLGYDSDRLRDAFYNYFNLRQYL